MYNLEIHLVKLNTIRVSWWKLLNSYKPFSGYINLKLLFVWKVNLNKVWCERYSKYPLSYCINYIKLLFTIVWKTKTISFSLFLKCISDISYLKDPCSLLVKNCDNFNQKYLENGMKELYNPLTYPHTWRSSSLAGLNSSHLWAVLLLTLVFICNWFRLDTATAPPPSPSFMAIALRPNICTLHLTCDWNSLVSAFIASYTIEPSM